MTASEKISILSNFITEKRFELFKKNINLRTRYISVLLEDIFQPHNASAVLRTCDCFGIQNVHIIENKNKYTLNPDIELGAAQWLTITKYNQQQNNTTSTIKLLKKQGYRIIATTPHKKTTNLEDFNISAGKFILCFGTELEGLSAELLGLADEYLLIPMNGFTESLNISVSAAICIHHLNWKLRQSSLNWQLSETEKETLLAEWLSASVNHADKILEEFEKRKQL